MPFFPKHKFRLALVFNIRKLRLNCFNGICKQKNFDWSLEMKNIFLYVNIVMQLGKYRTRFFLANNESRMNECYVALTVLLICCSVRS